MIDYKLWREAVIRLLKNNNLISHNRDVTEDIYYPYYEDGYKPNEAIKEDLGVDSLKNFNNEF